MAKRYRAPAMGTCNARFWMPFVILAIVVIATLAFAYINNRRGVTKEGFVDPAQPQGTQPVVKDSKTEVAKPAPAAAANATVITTMHDLNAVTIHGNDLGKILSVTSSGNCKNECNKQADCKAAVFREIPEKDGKNCFLKRTMPLNSFKTKDGDNTYLKI